VSVEHRAGLIADNALVGREVELAADACVQAKQLRIGDGVRIGRRARITGDSVTLSAGSIVEDDVQIDARRLALGYRGRIEARCRIAGMGTPSADEVQLGDLALLGSDCRVLLPKLLVGDYVKIHNHTLINGRSRCVIGHNTWIGQNGVLNAECELVIGNNVCLGLYTSVLTHAYYGDQLEGCTVFRAAPVSIGDDAWIMGGYTVVSSGVTIGSKAMVLTGSLVNRDVAPNHCAAGTPIGDVTDKIVPFVDRSLSEKQAAMRGYVLEFLAARHAGAFVERAGDFSVGGAEPFEIVFRDRASDLDLSEGVPRIVVAGSSVAGPSPRTTVIDLSLREYTKRLTGAEIELLSFLLSHRARFTPQGQRSVGSGAEHE
jgi:acetyltransferase-like isoleucine patch superfamily enzyme